MEMQQRGLWFWTVQVVSVLVFVAWGLGLLLFSWLAEGYADSSSQSDWVQARVAVGLVSFALPVGIVVWRRNALYLLLAVPISLVLFAGADLVLPQPPIGAVMGGAVELLGLALVPGLVVGV